MRYVLYSEKLKMYLKHSYPYTSMTSAQHKATTFKTKKNASAFLEGAIKTESTRSLFEVKPINPSVPTGGTGYAGETSSEQQPEARCSVHSPSGEEQLTTK